MRYLVLPLIYSDSARICPPKWNINRIHQASIHRYGQRRGSILATLAYIIVFLVLLGFFSLLLHFSAFKRISILFSPGSSLVYRKGDLRRIYEWEIESGHYPSKATIPPELLLATVLDNPALPHDMSTISTKGVGPTRIYLEVKGNVSFPPRPIPGSAIDLDIVYEKCDFSAKKYVRDCLDFLRVGAGLDTGHRVRRDVSQYRHIFINNGTSMPYHYSHSIAKPWEPEHEFKMKSGNKNWEMLSLPPLSTSPLPAHTICDPEDPRIFHMYWTGPFTDKTYLAITSFLYTQNLDLDLVLKSFCRPQLTLWIMPTSISLSPPASAEMEMMEKIRSNRWSSPFLHPRFKDIINFKVWNLTEQFDSLPELRNEWRQSSFTSNGRSMNFESIMNNPHSSARESLMVKMSDIVRFIVCHRYGGIYVDADTVFLRDWEELWGWKGAFAYRWSYHPQYNTAVIRLRKKSALGSFILRTALRNNLDFHPKTLSAYLKDAKLGQLLYRIPDALFDPAWLNMEKYQRDRPPQPFFKKFSEFFETPAANSAATQIIGFEGFFRGAFSYHFHNSWHRLVDVSHNYPDLGPRFLAYPSDYNPPRYSDRSDLDWSAVLKRTFEAYLRGEQPNMYGEWIQWE